VAPAFTLVPQVLVWVKAVAPVPVIEILLILMLAVPTFVRLKLCLAVLPMRTIAKLIDVVESDTTEPTPVRLTF